MKLELTIKELKDLMNANSEYGEEEEKVETPILQDDIDMSFQTYYIGTYAQLLTNGDIDTIVTPPYLDKRNAINHILDITWDSCITPREEIVNKLYEWDVCHPEFIEKEESDKNYPMSYEIHQVKM